MSYVTRRPTGSWTSVRPYSYYGNTVANYASVLAAAHQESENVELERKVMEYKAGTLPYEDLKLYINTKLTAALPGSQKELDFRQLLIDLDEYDIKQKLSLRRSQLQAKYASGGISAEEQLAIEKELLPLLKEGTTDFAEQVSTIATAQELATQEKKNVRLAEMQAKLSAGGLTTLEEIEVYKEARDLTDQGTQERAEIEQKLNGLKETLAQEDIERKATAKYIEMLDKYKDGGVTDEENLEITREMLNIYEPGSDEFLEWKKAEAELLGSIAFDAKSGSGKAQKALEEEAEVRYEVLQNEAINLQNKFDIGAITPEEYFQRQLALADEQQGLVNEYGNLRGVDASGELQSRFQVLQQLNNDIQTGNAVVVRAKNKESGEEKQAIIPLSELGAYATDEDIFGAEGYAGIGKVVTIIENGVEKKVQLNEDGSLEELSPVDTKSGKVAYEKTGNVLPYGKQTQTKAPAAVTQQQTAQQSPAQSTIGANILKTAMPASSALGTVKTSQPTSSSSKEKKTSSDDKKKTSTASKAADIVKSVVKNVTPTAKSYSALPTVAKIGSTTVKKGNIPGTLDFGITEKLKIGETVKKVVSSASSFIKNLFK